MERVLTKRSSSRVCDVETAGPGATVVGFSLNGKPDILAGFGMRREAWLAGGAIQPLQS